MRTNTRTYAHTYKRARKRNTFMHASVNLHSHERTQTFGYGRMLLREAG